MIWFAPLAGGGSNSSSRPMPTATNTLKICGLGWQWRGGAGARRWISSTLPKRLVLLKCLIQGGDLIEHYLYFDRTACLGRTLSFFALQLAGAGQNPIAGGLEPYRCPTQATD